VWLCGLLSIRACHQPQQQCCCWMPQGWQGKQPKPALPHQLMSVCCSCRAVLCCAVLCCTVQEYMLAPPDQLMQVLMGVIKAHMAAEPNCFKVRGGGAWGVNIPPRLPLRGYDPYPHSCPKIRGITSTCGCRVLCVPWCLRCGPTLWEASGVSCVMRDSDFRKGVDSLVSSRHTWLQNCFKVRREGGYFASCGYRVLCVPWSMRCVETLALRWMLLLMAWRYGREKELPVLARP
jgi:hypothetical protein